MRILMTSDACGGVGVFAEELAAALTARGHQVLVVVFSPQRPEDGANPNRRWAPFRLEWMDSGAGAAEVAADVERGRQYLAATGRQWRPDVLHSNHFAYVGAAAGAPTLLSVHSDVVSWWRTVRGGAPPDTGFQRWYRATAVRGLAEAALVVAPSRAARRDARTSFAVRRRIGTIPNGRDPEGFSDHGKRPLALAAGRVWDQGKQAHILGQVRRPVAKLEIALAGSMSQPGEGSKAATPQGVRLLGPLPATEMARWMARARAYIGTSVYEPFGLAVLEAALSGCALLLRDIASWRELWGPVASFYSRKEELEELLQRVASDAAWAAQRGAAARHHARRRYTATVMAAAYERAYRKLL